MSDVPLCSALVHIFGDHEQSVRLGHHRGAFTYFGVDSEAPAPTLEDRSSETERNAERSRFPVRDLEFRREHEHAVGQHCRPGRYLVECRGNYPSVEYSVESLEP